MPTRTILVVEDDPNDEAMTLRALRQSGLACSVIVAHSANEALDFLCRRGAFEQRTSPDPRVVFVDNTLPGVTGSELVVSIRHEPHLRNVPVVVLSGSSDGNVVDRCFQAGANSFLLKPIELGEYMKHVGNAAKYWLTLNMAPAP